MIQASAKEGIWDVHESGYRGVHMFFSYKRTQIHAFSLNLLPRVWFAQNRKRAPFGEVRVLKVPAGPVMVNRSKASSVTNVNGAGLGPQPVTRPLPQSNRE